MEIHQPVLLLDACCILNLHASGHLAGILATVPVQVAIPTTVQDKEIPSLTQLDPYSPAGSRWHDILDRGLLQTVDFENEAEELAFIQIAGDIGDDGEAACFAIALHRNFAVAIDDRAARKYATDRFPSLTLHYSLDVIKHWTDVDRISPAVIRTALNDIRSYGRYLPHRRHPLHDWWIDHGGPIE